jgi:hypothetical protein
MNGCHRALASILGILALGRGVRAQSAPATMPRLHHVGLNSVDPEKTIAWYLKVWPTATRAIRP